MKRTVTEVPKFISLLYFKWNLYWADMDTYNVPEMVIFIIANL